MIYSIGESYSISKSQLCLAKRYVCIVLEWAIDVGFCVSWKYMTKKCTWLILLLKILGRARSFFLLPLHRSSYQRRFIKKGVLTNFAIFTWKHLCQSLSFNKVAGLRPRDSGTGFPLNLAKILRTPFWQSRSG